MRPRLVVALVAALAPIAALGACGGKGAPSTTAPSDSAALVEPARALDGGADAAEDVDAAEDAAMDADAGADAAPDWSLFSEEPFPEKRTPVPKAAEWEAAPRRFIDRGGSSCAVRRVREWVRITGPWQGGLMLLGGGMDGVSLRKGEIILPVRRGDRREIELLVDDTSRFIRGVEETHMPLFLGMLSEQWTAGDERPSIVMQ